MSTLSANTTLLNKALTTFTEALSRSDITENTSRDPVARDQLRGSGTDLYLLTAIVILVVTSSLLLTCILARFRIRQTNRVYGVQIRSRDRSERSRDNISGSRDQGISIGEVGLDSSR